MYYILALLYKAMKRVWLTQPGHPNKIPLEHNIILVGQSTLFTIQYDYCLLWQLRQSQLHAACCIQSRLVCLGNVICMWLTISSTFHM